MKRIFIIILKALGLMFSWLTLSPLFFYMAKRCGVMNKGWRITLLLVSPMAWLCYALIGIFIFFGYLGYERKYGFLDKDRIERITKVRLPDFELIDYEGSVINFRGEYSDYMTIKFKDNLTDEFYATLDSLVEKDVWSKRERTVIAFLPCGDTVCLHQKVRMRKMI